MRRWSSLKLVRQLERVAQYIPTWLAVLVSVVCLATIAIWVQEDVIIHSPFDLFRRDALKIFFENAESFAIVAAVILYFKSAPDRKARKHYEAWSIRVFRILYDSVTVYTFLEYAAIINTDTKLRWSCS